ncbi:hypothetical protein EA462_04015 [Natrarchaeobius halalkaliphilus]|uniref:Uncharacterized protein n=1 Tax=Natrarchaeobius halalkaliphilus TaxID=1679091 RepID=A0A3N6P114_9EURY|nr:hypothetical protein [Natrarchaeobius halalkaliphilus]RQG91169.1 hypothetical protein EA462_04015 [Natrarchaeobius halalkaliphilus]
MDDVEQSVELRRLKVRIVALEVLTDRPFQDRLDVVSIGVAVQEGVTNVLVLNRLAARRM